MYRCVVDDKYIYTDSAEELSRIDRATGVVEWLTNDMRGLREMLVADGTLYFLDGEGVHSWSARATTTTTIAKFKKLTQGSSLTRFGDRICWGVDGETEATHSSVNCLDLVDHTVAQWVRVEGYSLFAAASGDRLFGAVFTDTDRCVVFDLTDPKAPKQLGVFPETCSMFAVTPRGPAMVSPGVSFIDSQAKVWMLDPMVHRFALADGGAFLESIGGRTYLIGGKGPAQIDLATGTVIPLPGAVGSALCGDSKHLYVAGPDKTILEIPNQ